MFGIEWAALRLALGGKIAAVGKAIASLSPRTKLILAGIALAIVGYLFHGHLERKAFNVAWKSGYAQAIADVKVEQAKARTAAIAHKQTIEHKDTATTEKASSDYANDVDHLGAGYDELRRQPPPVRRLGGSQGSVPGIPVAAGGPDAAAQGKDAGLVEVDWLDLLSHGESCDTDRAKLTRLQDWLRGVEANHAEGNAKP
jgi:hypothetical protein